MAPPMLPLATAATTIVLAGEYDIANCGRIGELVATALRHPDMREVTLDMSAVTFLDAAALGAMVTARGTCSARGIRLLVRSPSAPVRRLMSITDMDEILRPGDASSTGCDPLPV